jgi:hypothetical protein
MPGSAAPRLPLPIGYVSRRLRLLPVALAEIELAKIVLEAVEKKQAKEQEKEQKEFELVIAEKDAEIARRVKPELLAAVRSVVLGYAMVTVPENSVEIASKVQAVPQLDEKIIGAERIDRLDIALPSDVVHIDVVPHGSPVETGFERFGREAFREGMPE